MVSRVIWLEASLAASLEMRVMRGVLHQGSVSIGVRYFEVVFLLVLD
jgi:hypothetical protein